MGLDQSIYKYSPGYTKTIEELAQVNSDTNNYVSITVETDKAQQVIKEFIKYIEPILRSDMLQDTEQVKYTVTFIVKTILYSGVDHDRLKWNLYNNMSVLNFDTTENAKNEVTNKLIDLMSWYELPQEQIDRLTLEQSLSFKKDSLEEEVCYWRKYHELNEYILSNFGGGNCIDTSLTKPIVKSILEFIKNDSNNEYPEIEQVEELLADWDNTCTYVYRPWW